MTKQDTLKEKKVTLNLKKWIRFYDKLLIEHQNDLFELSHDDSIDGESKLKLIEEVEEKISRVYDIKNVLFTLINRFSRITFDNYLKTIDTLANTLKEAKEIVEEIANMEKSK